MAGCICLATGYICITWIACFSVSPITLAFSSVALTEDECCQTDNGSPTELSKLKIGLTGEREVARNMTLGKKDTCSFCK